MNKHWVFWEFKLRLIGKDEMELVKQREGQKGIRVRVENNIPEDLEEQASKGTFSLFQTQGGR